MPVRSVLEIDVDDAAFRQFHTAFQRYQAQLLATPTAWRNVSAATHNAQASTAALAASATIHNQQLASAVHHQNTLGRAVASTNLHMHALQRSTQQVARHITDATRNILRWGSISTVLAGLAGFGGLFGLTRLGQNAANDYRTATGFGVSPGQLRALQTVFPYLVDPTAMLRSAAAGRFGGVGPEAQAQTQLGIGTHGTPFDITMRTLEAARTFAVQHRNDPFMANDPRAALFGRLGIGQEELLRLREESPEEFRRQQGQARAFVRTAEQDRATSRAWRDLMVTLGMSKTAIEKAFIVGLRDLAEPIGRLSHAVADAVGTILHSKLIRKWIDAAAEGMKWLAEHIDTPEFQARINRFLEAVGKLGEGLVKLAEAVARLLGLDVTKADPATRKWNEEYAAGLRGKVQRGELSQQAAEYHWRQAGNRDLRPLSPDPATRERYREDQQNAPAGFTGAGMGFGGPAGSTGNYADRARDYYKFLTDHGLDPAHAHAMLANALAESGLDPRNRTLEKNGTYSTGLFQWNGERWVMAQSALGQHQYDPYAQLSYAVREQWKRNPGWFRPGTAEGLTSSFESDFERPAHPTGRADELRRVLEMLGPGRGESTPRTSQRGGQPQAALPSVRIYVDNRTGGSAVISSSAMA